MCIRDSIDRPLTELEAFARQVAGCTKCRLAEGRTQVVFGIGDPEADLMFVGEAPGFHEDKQGYPFVGQAGKLLDTRPTGITRVHGTEQEVNLGGSCVVLYPLYHPAAALYTPAMLQVLEQDFARLPELLGREVAPPTPLLTPVAPEPAQAQAVQLGLF